VAVHDDDRPSDLDLRLGEIQIRPPETAQLATPRSGRGREQDEEVQVRIGGIEEARDLGR
jgi:hypothetical protein